MITMYDVTYRTEKRTKSGKPSKAVNRFRVHRKSFYSLLAAQKFAELHPDPLGWTKIKPVEVDDTLLADIFHL